MKRYLIVILALVLVSSFFLAGCSKKEVVEKPLEVAEEETSTIGLEEVPSQIEGDVEEPIDEVEPAKENTDEVDQVIVEEPEKEIEEEAEEPELVSEDPVVEEPIEEPVEVEPVVEEPIEEEIVIEGFAIKIEGQVAIPLTLGLSQLKELDDLIYSNDYYSLNSFGTTGHTNFKGIKLWDLLTKEAQVLSSASRVRIVATDGYEMSFGINDVIRQDYIDETDQSKQLPIIIAWEENGVEYDGEKNPPYKLVVGQREPGDVNKPLWVSNIDKIIVE